MPTPVRVITVCITVCMHECIYTKPVTRKKTKNGIMTTSKELPREIIEKIGHIVMY